MNDNSGGDRTDFLFVHVPKLGNYYKLIDEYTYVNYLPMGVFALCDRLNHNGVRSRIKHMGLETILDDAFSIADWVKARRIPVVGMSLQWHFQSFDVIDVAKKIKATSPETVIVLGGLTASRFAAEILSEFPTVDAVICGDADRGAVTFAKAVLEKSKDFSAVENCVWRDSTGTVVDNGISFVADNALLSSLDYGNLSLLDHHEEYRDYYKMPMFWMNNDSVKANLRIRMASETMFPLALGRGCTVSCVYCGGGTPAQRKLCGRKKIAFRSVDSVLDTIEQAMGYGYSSFLTCFDPTPEDDSYYLELLEGMRKRNLKPGLAVELWSLPTERFIESYARTVNLKRSYIALSPDTGSEKVRRRNKGFYYSNEELFSALDRLYKYTIPTLLYFTIGLVDETAEDIEQTVQLSRTIKKRWRKIVEGSFCLPVQIEPTSPMFENPEKYGLDSTRSSFMDFYKSHGGTDSGPFTYLGYTNRAYPEAEGNLKRYEEALQQVRCRAFCPMSFRLFNRLELGFLSKAVCRLRYARWKKMGFGHPPAERRTFR